MVTVKTQMVREERWRETTRMMVLQQVNRLEITESGTYEIQDHIETHKYNNHERSTHKSERQVLMQYMKAAHRRSTS